MTGTFDPIADTDRELRGHDSGLNALLIRRTYDATPDDVWDALTDPERLVRWFLPITGDLRVGRRYSLEGNASGEIVRCDKPREIVVTWEFGGGSSDVRLLLTPKGRHDGVGAGAMPVLRSGVGARDSIDVRARRETAVDAGGRDVRCARPTRARNDRMDRAGCTPETRGVSGAAWLVESGTRTSRSCVNAPRSLTSSPRA
jgi:uncharacterized protein YndB with AHSA1/START domain